MIVGEGLILRVPVADDRERWLELLHDPDQRRFGTPSFVTVPSTIDELDARLIEARARFESREPGSLAVVEADDPAHFLGTIAWRLDVPARLRIGDIGYAIHPDARGRGVGRRAIRTVTRWLTRDDQGPHLVRVQLDHSVENLASCRVALAAGFEQEGVRRAFLPLVDPAAPGGERRHDVCLHGFVPQS
jgi:RimJ/RimL family protein N-acetyltransferase